MGCIDTNSSLFKNFLFRQIDFAPLAPGPQTDGGVLDHESCRITGVQLYNNRSTILPDTDIDVFQFSEATKDFSHNIDT